MILNCLSTRIYSESSIEDSGELLIEKRNLAIKTIWSHLLKETAYKIFISDLNDGWSVILSVQCLKTW